MKCPYYHQVLGSGAGPVCLGTAVAFEPSERDLDFCATDRHRWCPLYRNAGRDIVLAVQEEAARATG